MAQQPNKYTQGYSDYTIANHITRTAESDAAFLLPHIKKTDNILDVGCGPGTITTSLARYANQGTTVGIDISGEVLKKAKSLATEANVPTDGPGSVVFKEGNVLERLSYEDNKFDIVYCSQVLGHLKGEDPLRALTEMRRVLKPGGILATRDGMDSHFYPRSMDLDRLWSRRASLAIHKGEHKPDPTGSLMPSLFRSAGFDAEGGKVVVGAGTKVYSGPEARKFLTWRAKGQLQKGDPFYQSWLDAGITEGEIRETLVAVEKWANTDDAWFVALQCDMLAWK